MEEAGSELVSGIVRVEGVVKNREAEVEESPVKRRWSRSMMEGSWGPQLMR